MSKPDYSVIGLAFMTTALGAITKREALAWVLFFIGLGFVVIPFLSAWFPSRRAIAQMEFDPYKRLLKNPASAWWINFGDWRENHKTATKGLSLVVVLAIVGFMVWLFVARPANQYSPVFVSVDQKEQPAFADDFRGAFAADSECSGIVLVDDNSKGNPTQWADEKGYWFVIGTDGMGAQTGDAYFNWRLYRRGRSFSKDAKTPAQGVRDICNIVKGKGGTIE
jgi:hypothetical protein